MLLQVDPSIPSQTTGQVVIAIGVLMLTFVGLLLAGIRLEYAELDDEAADVVAAVKRQLARQRSGSVRLLQDDDLEARRNEIAGAFDASGIVEEHTTVRGAFTELSSHVRELVGPYVQLLPKPARRFFALSLTILLFGGVALSADAIRRALLAETRPLAPLQWPRLALEESTAALSIFRDWVFAVPVLGPAVDFVMAVGILLGEWTYRRWWVFAILLAAVALRIYLLDRAGADSVSFDLPTPMDIARRVAMLVAAGWGASLAAIGLGRVLLLESPATLGAGVMAVVSIGVLAVLAWAVFLAARGMRDAYAAAAGENERMRLLVRIFGLSMAVFVAPVLPVWFVVAMTNLPMIVSAFLSAALPVQVGVGLLALGAVAAGLYVVREAASEVKGALKETISRRAWKAAVFGRAVPVGLVVLVYFVALGFQIPWVFAIPVAIVAGVSAVALWKLVLRLRDRGEAMPDGQASRPTAIVHAYNVSTPAGDQFIARVNGDLVAHPTRDGAVDAVIARAREAFADRRPRPTFGEAHARMLTNDGVTDLEETERRLRADARREIEGTVLRKGGVEYDELRNNLSNQVPAEIADDEIDRAPQAPTTDVTYRDGMLLPV